MLYGVFVIFLFYALGEALAALIHGYVPGCVLGMLLLFAALCLKLVSPRRVKPVSRALSAYMALFFLPAGVGIVNSLDLLSRYWQAVLAACALSTVAVIVVVAVTQEGFERRRKHD